MQTACPHCSTVFRLTDTQLRMADGMVRCGVCQQTFNALPQQKSPARKTTTQQTTTRQTTARKSPGKKNVAAKKPAHHPRQEPLRKVVPDAFRKPGTAAAVWAGLGWSLLIILLALALLVEYTWFHPNQLQQQAELKPWLEKFCALSHCELEPSREPDKIEMLSRTVYSHPTTKNALMIAVTMVNQASHEQPYPDVQIDFSNVRGGVIAARRFTPDEYLGPEAAGSALLPTATEISFTLEIQDPGKEALTYEFRFL